MRKLFATVAMVVLVPGASFASTQELDRAVIKATRFGMQPMPAADRRALVDAALAYWRSFDSRIPRNSPATQEWLSGEMNTNDTARLGRVINTPEYALYQLEQYTTCVRNLEALSGWIGGDPLTEMYGWTKVLYCYGDPNAIIHYLQLAGLSNGKYDGPFSLQHFSFFHRVVTGSLANAIEAESHR
ncbi:hypothetical protein NS226_04200 [Aureimonas ureilytica]|uniref:Uncharacterized protein n=1 Tax=Aureimonas ureilytica TaxID=401562 RepID=A0A175RCC3_9HYPH|nr:hypothetical protein [Aureimonas ureilytica]KTQ97554.1 hypothetical protein NS226_04200 [Aureimonas ureilytica]